MKIKQNVSSDEPRWGWAGNEYSTYLGRYSDDLHDEADLYYSEIQDKPEIVIRYGDDPQNCWFWCMTENNNRPEFIEGKRRAVDAGLYSEECDFCQKHGSGACYAMGGEGCGE